MENSRCDTMWLIFAISLIGNGMCTSDKSPLEQQYNKTAENERLKFEVFPESKNHTNGEEKLISGYMVNMTASNVEHATLNTLTLNITHTETNTLAIDELATINNKGIDHTTFKVPTESTKTLNIKNDQNNEMQGIHNISLKNYNDENDIMHEISRQMNVILDIFNETNGNETKPVTALNEINIADKLIKEKYYFIQNQSYNNVFNKGKNYTLLSSINEVTQKYNPYASEENNKFELKISDHVNNFSNPIFIIPEEYRDNPNHKANSTGDILKKEMQEAKEGNVNDRESYSTDEFSSLSDDNKAFKTKNKIERLNTTTMTNDINNTDAHRALNRFDYKKNESMKRLITNEFRSRKDKKKGYFLRYNDGKLRKPQVKSFIDYNNMMVDLISRYNARVGDYAFIKLPDNAKEFELYGKIFSYPKNVKGISSELLFVEPGKYTFSKMYIQKLINGLLNKWPKPANRKLEEHRKLSQRIYRQMYEDDKNLISDSNKQNDVLEIKIKKLRSQMFEILLTIEQIKRFLEEREILGGLQSKKNKKMVKSAQFDKLWKQIYFNYVNETNLEQKPCLHEHAANINDVSGSFVTLFKKIFCFLKSNGMNNNNIETNQRGAFNTGKKSSFTDVNFFKSSSTSYEIHNLKSLLKTFNIIHKRFIQNIIETVDNIERNQRQMNDEPFKPVPGIEVLMDKLDSISDVTGDNIARKRRNISHIEDTALRYILTLVNVLLNDTPATEAEDGNIMGTLPTRQVTEIDIVSSSRGEDNLETKTNTEDQMQTEKIFSGSETTTSFTTEQQNNEPNANMYNNKSKNKQYVFVSNRETPKVRYAEPRHDEDEDQSLRNRSEIKDNSQVMDTSTVQSATNRFYFYSNDYEQYTSSGSPEMQPDTTTEVNKIMVELKPKRSEFRRRLEEKPKNINNEDELNYSLEQNPFRISNYNFSLFRDYTDLMNDDADNVTDLITTDSVIRDSTKNEGQTNSSTTKVINKEKESHEFFSRKNYIIYENKDSESNAIWQQFKNGYHFNSEGLLESVTDESEVHTITNKILLKKNTMLLDSLDYGISAEYEKDIESTKNKDMIIGENTHIENKSRQKVDNIIEAGTYKPYQDKYFTEYQDSPTENVTETIEDSMTETHLFNSNSKSMVDYRSDRDIRTETELGEQDDKGNFGLERDENFQDPSEIEDSPAYFV